MTAKKRREDQAGSGEPLTDNPFGALGGLRNDLPPGQSPPEPVTKEPAAAPPFQVGKTAKGGYHVAIEKRGSGKVVTVVHRVSGDAKALLKALQKSCGAGGSVREDTVEIQGDHVDKVKAVLRGLLG